MLIDDPSGDRFTDSQVQDEIQKAQEWFVLDTRCLTDNVTDTSVADQAAYDLQSDVLDIKRIAHKGLELKRISKFELDRYTGQDWSDDSGTPKYYYVDLDPNNKKYYLYPIPKGEDAGANLAVEYIKIPPTLSSGSSVPLDSHTLLSPYHDALAYKSASSLLDINPSQETIVKSQRYEKKYSDLVAHCIETFKALSITQPVRMRGGRYHGEL
jgi:hypothetical protein